MSDENLFRAFMSSLYCTLDAPVTWFRDNIVVPNQQQYPWYHQKYRRVPTIDQCYVDDAVCDFEANAQFLRDKKVDSEILNILRSRYEDCMLYESPDHLSACKEVLERYQDAEECWFIKYGDLGANGDARKAYMKQKHRMIFEKRYGQLSDQTRK
ncbi:NADH dehydrogenase [ubiquinone] 1 beta subcomplex subunit 10-like [Plodia interpunctella]|uniref:NADH dehydrogenase [ubiquinone] 1 beta subcomplex subunit 10-like n=1 Tax=Plodia interpunctella TaxID=58824 RepID=UPI002367C1E9|nr:NADH dehydrogenase [ubiquinone] 1 beta subcomplex subunit 10-like [Plodia interpunctella]